MAKHTTGGSTSKLALPSEEQDRIRRAKKPNRHNHGPKGPKCASQTKPLSIPEEANRNHLLLIIEAVCNLQLNTKRSEFVSAFVVAYSKLTREEVQRSSKTRIAMTFETVENLLGTEAVKLFSKDWGHAKTAFFRVVHDNSLQSCMDKVADERREARERYEASRQQVTTTIGDYVDVGMEDIVKALQLH